PAVTEKYRADHELILVDQTMLSELRHDGCAAGRCFRVVISSRSSSRTRRSLFHVTSFRVREKTSLVASFIQGGDRSMLVRLLPRAVRIWRREGAIHQV